MIVFLPIRPQLTGGTSSFARKFKQGMEAQGHTVVFSFQPNFDVLLVPAACSWQYLLHARRNRRKIIHRLDGVHYPTTVAGWLYPIYNFPLWLARQFADVTIYQSRYAKFCCEKFLGPARSIKEYVIYNGVDVRRFSPLTNSFPVRAARLPRRYGEKDITFLTAQKFRRRDQLEPLIIAVEIFRQRYDSLPLLVVAGDFYGEAKSMPHEYSRAPWIKFLGPLPHEGLVQELRRADVFLYCHPNSACPNNVLEAMASGLPIAGVADGGMLEIMQTPGVEHQVFAKAAELIPAPGDGFFKPRRFDVSAFADNLHKILHSKERYAAASRQIAVERFSSEKMIQNYLTALDWQSGI